MNAQEAVDAPRLHHQWLPDRIDYERIGLSPDTVKLLEAMGHTLRPIDGAGRRRGDRRRSARRHAAGRLGPARGGRRGGRDSVDRLRPRPARATAAHTGRSTGSPQSRPRRDGQPRDARHQVEAPRAGRPRVHDQAPAGPDDQRPVGVAEDDDVGVVALKQAGRRQHPDFVAVADVHGQAADRFREVDDRAAGRPGRRCCPAPPGPARFAPGRPAPPNRRHPRRGRWRRHPRRRRRPPGGPGRGCRK